MYLKRVFKVLLVKTLTLIRILTDLFTEMVFGFFYKGKGEKLPPIKDLTLLESAQSLAAKIRSGKLKSEDLIKSYISRIQDVNPILNAVVDERYEEAILEAKAVDKMIEAGEMTPQQMANEKPFLGIPFTIKDCFPVKGLRQTSGLVVRKDYVAVEDAPVVTFLRKAGAIPLAVTNVSELCMWWESNNNVYGRSNNPYDTTRIVGGSSGGEGSILGAAGSIIGVGSDIGGSLNAIIFQWDFLPQTDKRYCPKRWPVPNCYSRTEKSFNNWPYVSLRDRFTAHVSCARAPNWRRKTIIGHSRVVPVVGAFPKAGNDTIQAMRVAGPMCRYACDLIPALMVMAADQLQTITLNAPVDIKKLKYYYMEDDGGFPLISKVHPELKAAIKKVVVHLDKAYGIKAQKVSIRELTRGLEIWSNKMGSAQNPTFCELLTNCTGTMNPWTEFPKWLLRLSNHTLPAILLGMSQSILHVQPGTDRYERTERLASQLERNFKDLLGQDGIFLYPPNPHPAPYHNQPILMPLNFAYTAIFNVLGFPVTQCPLGLSTEGLPLGVQVISNLHNDHLTLAFALELEKAFGGWVCPCPIP